MKKTFITFTALALAACSSGGGSGGAPANPANPSGGRQDTPTNIVGEKVVGQDFKIGKALAIVETLPETNESFVSVHIFDQSANVTCENLYSEEARTKFEVGGMLEIGKALVISEATGAEETAANDAAANSEDVIVSPITRVAALAESDPDLTIPAGVATSEAPADGIFLTKDGGEDVAVAGYLIVESRTGSEVRGVLAAKGKSADKPSKLSKTSFVAEVCALPAEVNQ